MNIRIYLFLITAHVILLIQKYSKNRPKSPERFI